MRLWDHMYIGCWLLAAGRLKVLILSRIEVLVPMQLQAFGQKQEGAAMLAIALALEQVSSPTSNSVEVSDTVGSGLLELGRSCRLNTALVPKEYFCFSN